MENKDKQLELETFLKKDLKIEQYIACTRTLNDLYIIK